MGLGLLTVIDVGLDRWYTQVLAEILYSCCVQLSLGQRGHCARVAAAA